MTLHCDSCGKALGTYLYGKGGIEEKALIFGNFSYRLPDIVCMECWNEGYSLERPKHAENVYNYRGLQKYAIYKR